MKGHDSGNTGVEPASGRQPATGSRFDVIVVGAGVIGLAVAAYLTRESDLKVCILDREESWASGSTARANGGFRQQFSTPANIRLSQLSVPVFEDFERLFGTSISLCQQGYLFLTASEEGERGLRANLDIQRAHDVPVEWVDADWVAARTPYVRCDDLRGGCFCSRDGYADSYSIAAGFGRAALEQGAVLQLSTTVEDILTRGGRVSGVATSAGELNAPVVVNAAGPAAAALGKMVDIDIPVEPVRRMLVMTEDFATIPEGSPMIIDVDTGFLMRTESGRILLGWSDPDEPAGFNLQFDPSFIDLVGARAIERIPVLEEAQINPRRGWAGLYEVTPDHHCIIDRLDEVEGLILANGFSGHGMMHAPAVGMIVTDLILDGATERLDIRPLRLSRFAEGDLIEETVVL